MHTQTQRPTDRQIDRQTGRQAGRQRDRHYCSITVNTIINCNNNEK